MNKKLIILLILFVIQLSSTSNNVVEQVDVNASRNEIHDFSKLGSSSVIPDLPIRRSQTMERPSPPGHIGLDASSQDFTTTYDQQVSITGKLQDGVGSPWGLANVSLYLNNQTHVGGTVVQTVQTDAQGNFQFDRNFIYTDIGIQTYEVYFPNDEADEFRLAGVVKTGTITLKDKVTPTLTSNKLTVAINLNFTITYTLKNDGGADVDPDSSTGLNVQLTISSSAGSHINGHADNVSVIPFISGQAIKKYTAPANTNNYQLTIAATVVNTGGLPLVDFTNAGKSINVNVAAELGFSYNMTVGGKTFDSNLYYDRNNSVIQIDGLLEDPNSLINTVGEQFIISFAGAGTSVADITDVTDASSRFTKLITLSKANFPDPNSDLTITITFTNVSLTIIPNPTTITMKLAGTFGSFSSASTTEANNGTHIVSKMYWPLGDNSIFVQGILKDGDGVAINGITVNIRINDKDRPGIPWVGHNTLSTVTATTNVTGGFSKGITIPSISSSYRWLTINYTLVSTPKWNEPISPVSVEVVSFMLFRTVTTTALEDRIGSNYFLTLNGLDSFDVLNDTLKSYFDGAAFYNISLTDEFGRFPLGVTYNGLLQVFDPSGTKLSEKTYTGLVNATNSGQFTVNFSDFKLLAETIAQLNLANAKFKAIFTIGSGNTNLAVSIFTEQFITFGPDDVDPEIQNVTTSGSSSGIAEPLSIFVTLNFAKSALDNIRNVTLFYELSSNIAKDQVNATFSGTYTAVNMTYNAGQQNYQYTIPFDTHGRWVRWYVVVYDLAGQGLNQNGTTNTGYPGWDHSWSRTANHGSSSNPQYSRMGDLEIQTVDLADSVLINGVLLTSSVNVSLNATILVSFDLPQDLSGYDNVSIYIRLLSRDPVNGSIIGNSSWVEYSMNFTLSYLDGGINYDRYVKFLNATELNMDWFTQLDYYFNYTDGAGNIVWTESLSSQLDHSVYKETWVTDEVDPVSTPTNTTSIELLLDNANNTGISNWEIYNQTSAITISYNVTDTGSGLRDINVTIWLFTVNSEGVYNYTEFSVIVMVQDGEIVSPGTLELNAPVGTFYVVEFEIPSEALQEGNNVTYEISVVDRANREIIINDKDSANPVRFEVIPAPEVITPQTDVFTTFTSIDAQGNTVLITSVIQQTQQDKGNRRILLIVVGFIGGLTALIIWYQRHNITEYFARRRRKNLAESELKDLIGEIERLRAEGKYRRAILLTWEALERGARQIIQTPRRYNQTAKEFTEFLSTITIVERETLLTLSDVFEMARYGKGQPGTDELDDGVKALRITIDTLIQSGATMRFDEDDDF